MVRTRAENTGRRAVAAKAPRKQLGGGSSSSSILSSPQGSKDKNNGGNPVRWTPTPSWQKGIGNFFAKTNSSDGETSSRVNEVNDEITPSTQSSTSAKS